MFTVRHSLPRLGAVTLLAVLTVGLTAGTAAAAVSHTHDSTRDVVRTEYFPDDICGPRAGWTTFVTSTHLVITDLGDSIHVAYGERGTYTTDFDDPSIADYSSRFTDAQHFNVTRGGTVQFTEQWRDFPGTIRIHEHIVFVEVDGDVRIDRDEVTFTGCP
jgi:hypothetical protein